MGLASTVNQCRRYSPLRTGALPGQVVLSCVRKLAEYKPACGPASVILTWLLLEFLPQVPSVIDSDLKV